MQSNNVGLISRSSSAALSMVQQPTIFDDMNIAAGLLAEPKDPRHRSSFTGVSFVGVDGSDNPPQRSDGQPDGNHEGRSRRGLRTSNTWTSSSGDVLSDQDDVDDRTVFVQEYNRLARKHGVRQVDPEEFDTFNDDLINTSTKPGSWFSRKILRKTSSSQSVKLKPERHLKHRRSISDLSIRLKARRDKLKDKNLQELVRLCGSSLLYLPTEYAAGSLAVPTCFRATAQYLVQHAPSTRGVFRVPGSQSIVAALYNHYGSMDEDGQVVSGTVRCPTLPDHIRCDVHDVASAFKKFLSGLPGGILGSLQLFNVFISIQTQLRGDPELTRTKQSKVRARLIALAIATLKSQYRRELICAVFGLLSMIGRAAEIAPREDDRGRPLPTSDLMGYGPLGVVFGPLLVGDLLEDYTMRIANPQGGLVLLPISPPKSRKEKYKKSRTGEEGTAFNTHVDKIKVANGITEMLITHWRDVVRHMRNLSALKIVVTTKSVAVRGPRQPTLRPSASESFALRKPPDWGQFKSPLRRLERSVSPTPTRRFTRQMNNEDGDSAFHHGDMLVVKKHRSKNKPLSNHRLSGGRSLSILSPTAEDKIKEEQSESSCPDPPCTSGSLRLASEPLKDKFYSPSSSSDDGSFPSGMIPLPPHREEPITVPEILDKENKNPRPAVATAMQVDSAKMEDPFEYDSKQQLHFMSTPTFSNLNKPKSSRKKTRHSKESSGTTRKGKSTPGSGSPAKLQKKSPASVESDRSKDQTKTEKNEEPLKNEKLEPRNYNAELSQFVADWTALDMRRKVLQSAKSKNELQNFKAVLDAEQAHLEARYESIKVDKVSSERNLAILEARQEGIKEENPAAEKTKVNLESSQNLEHDMPSQYHRMAQEAETVFEENSDSKKEQISDADLDSLESALEASHWERQSLGKRRLELESDRKKYLTKWESTNTDLNIEDRDIKLDAEYAALESKTLTLDAAENASRADVEAIVAKLSVLDETPKRHPNRELSVRNPLITAADTESRLSPFKDHRKLDERTQGASHTTAQPGSLYEDQRPPAAIRFPPSPSENRSGCADNFSATPDAIMHSSTVIRKDLAAFRADVAAWKTKWKPFNQGKQTISSSDKKLHDDEKTALDARWNVLKARMDAQIEIEDSKGLSKSTPSLPFKHLVGNPDQFLSVPSPPKPEITVSRASSDDYGEGRLRSSRKIGGSEPGLLPRERSRSPRRVSRSLYEDPKRKKNLLDISKISRDPLSRVSREEDDASLAVLARALDADAGQDVLKTMPKPAAADNQTEEGRECRGTRPDLLRETSNIVKDLNEPLQSDSNENKQDGSDNVTRQPIVSKASELERGAADRSIKQPSGPQVPQSGGASTSFGGEMSPSSLKPEAPELLKEVTIPSSAMQIPTEKPASSVRRSDVPILPTEIPTARDGNEKRVTGSPNKISALVARFSQGKQEPVSVSPPSRSPAKSPTKTPIRVGPDLQADTGTPKDGIVSPYTINPASPARSQKSEKTPQSPRAAVGGEARSLLDPKSSPVRKATPKRVLRDSLYDSTPLRPVSRVPGAKSPRSTPSPTKAPNSYAVPLRSIQKNTDGSPARISSRPSTLVADTYKLDRATNKGNQASPSRDMKSPMIVPPPRFEIESSSSRAEEHHVKESSASSSRTIRAVRKSTKEATTRTRKAAGDRTKVQLRPNKTHHTHDYLSDLAVFDGPPSTSNIGRVLPRPDPVPVAHHLQMLRPPTTGPPDAPDMGMNSASQFTSPPPGRSSSLLYNQVRNIQRQLSEKTEEIQHLKQQLSARGNLDIGTLSEELRETKRDLQNWKARAEVAEKQLEILMKIPSRSNSLKHTENTSSRQSNHQHRSGLDSRKEEGTMADRIRKALHGMDGAGSPRRRSSDESTETVIRDLKEVITGSEYTMWAEQTMNAIDSADSEERIR